MTSLATVEFRVYEELKKLKTKSYVLADTRVPNVSLFDHLYLTAGIAIAMTKELLQRGNTSKTISGEDISIDELNSVVRISSLLHDWGKDHPSAYRDHVERSVAWTKRLMEQEDVEEPYKTLVLSAVRRHHLENDPRTPLEKTVCLADSYASAADRPELARAETPDELLKFSSTTLELEGKLFGANGGVRLLLGDTDKIKAYVFETTRLPEIRGGSEILNELNGEKLESLLKQKGLGVENLIYNGGGSFLAVVPASLADDLSAAIEELYLEETTHVTMTVVQSSPLGFLDFGRGLKPYALKGETGLTAIEGRGLGSWLLSSHFGNGGQGWPQRKGFGELVSSLASQLRLEKGMKSYVPFIETLPIARRCESCGTRGATSYDDVGGEHLCMICEGKRRKGRTAKSRLIRKFEQWLKVHQKLDLALQPPTDLDELSKKYEGYVAFVYADGNDIGRLLFEARTAASYRHISETLSVATENAVFEALFRAVGKKRLVPDRPLPFEIVNIGGDDVTVITTGPLAWKFSLEFLKAFESGVRPLGEELKREIRCSLGFIIAKSTYPVYYMEKLAGSLLHAAKSTAKSVREPKSTLSYLYLTTPIAAENAEELIKDYYRAKDGVYLTMRPYSLEEAEAIWKLATELKAVLATSQIHLWEQALQKGSFFAANYLLYQISRMQPDKKTRLRDLLEYMSNVFGLTLHEKLFGVNRKEQVSTPLIDVLEVIKFSKGELDGSP